MNSNTEEIQKLIKEEIQQLNKEEIQQLNKEKLRNFIELNEIQKNISEKDKYIMIIQLINCACYVELSKYPEKNSEHWQLVRFKWILIAEHVKKIWKLFKTNKYENTIKYISSMKIWCDNFDLNIVLDND